MNKVQILGIIILLAGIIISFFYKNVGIGLGAGLTVYKKTTNYNNTANDKP